MCEGEANDQHARWAQEQEVPNGNARGVALSGHVDVGSGDGRLDPIPGMVVYMNGVLTMCQTFLQACHLF